MGVRQGCRTVRSRCTWLLTWIAALDAFAAFVEARPMQEPPAPAVAQTVASSVAGSKAAEPVIVELRLRDGSVIYGVVQSETPDRVVVRTLAGGIVEVNRAQIASLAPARGEVVDGQFWASDSNATRLLFSPTGRSLRKGQGYIGVYEFLLPFVQVGVTERFSMGAGITSER